MRLRRILSVLLILVLSVSLCACSSDKNEKNNGQSNNVAENTDVLAGKKGIINIYSHDKNMWSYLGACVTGFNEKYPDIQIKLNYETPESYIEKIVRNNTDSSVVADIYMISSTEIEKAYLAGITTENTYKEYSTDNYAGKSLVASSFKDKLIGYPINFATQVMVCNNDYDVTIPSTFEKMKELSESIEVKDGQNMEHIINWNLSDMYLNYNFLGNALTIFGDKGEDGSQTMVNTSSVRSAARYFQELTVYYNVTRDSVTADSVMTSFVEGKTIFALLNSSDLVELNKKNEEVKLNYSISKVPDLKDGLDSASLSTTKMLVVNPYSNNVEMAKEVAKFFTYDMGDIVYEKTGDFGTKLPAEMGSCEAVYASYEDSAIKSKLMNIGDFYINLDIMLHNIADGNDVEEELVKLENILKETLK